MVLRDLERLIDALLDSDGRHHNHEFGEAEAFVQLEDGAQIDIGFACARLHFHGEVAGSETGGWRQAVAKLNLVEVGNDLVVQQGQAVADAQRAIDKAKLLLRATGNLAGNGKVSAVDLLPAKQVADGFDGGVLVIEVRLKMQFHPCTPSIRAMCLSWRARSSSSSAGTDSSPAM